MSISLCFNREQYDWTIEAVEFAEDLVKHFYRLVYRDWRDLHYDIKTLADLQAEEVTDQAFAQLVRYEMVTPVAPRKTRSTEFYRICIQDHKILDAVEHRKDGIDFRPLLLYVVTHELIHVIRFGRLLEPHEIPSEKAVEEARVHKVTGQILKDIRLPGLDRVLDRYRSFNIAQTELFH